MNESSQAGCGREAFETAYKLGFLRAAEWTQRDDLRADLDSPAYAKDRARDLATISPPEVVAMDMLLCEFGRLVPRPDVLYRPIHSPGCAECERLAASQIKAYGKRAPTYEEADAARAALSAPPAAMAERWIIARQAVIDDVPDSRPIMGYTVFAEPFVSFATFEEASAALAELKLPLGWVCMKTTQDPWPSLFATPVAAVAQPVADISARGSAINVREPQEFVTDERAAFENTLQEMPLWEPEFEVHRAWVEAFAWNVWQVRAALAGSPLECTTCGALVIGIAPAPVAAAGDSVRMALETLVECVKYGDVRQDADAWIDARAALAASPSCERQDVGGGTVALRAQAAEGEPSAPEAAPAPSELSSAVFTVLEGFTLPPAVQKILETAYYSAPKAAPAGDAYQKALELRIAQGWQLGGNACPVLYTDTINGDQVCRDDLWLATTAGLKGAPAPRSSPMSNKTVCGSQAGECERQAPAPASEAVAWLVEPNGLSSPRMKRELTFDRPHERPDWTVTPLGRIVVTGSESGDAVRMPRALIEETVERLRKAQIFDVSTKLNAALQGVKPQEGASHG